MLGVEICIGLQGGMVIKGWDPKDLWKRVCTQLCDTLSIYALGASGLLLRLVQLHREPNYFRMGFSGIFSLVASYELLCHEKSLASRIDVMITSMRWPTDSCSLLLSTPMEDYANCTNL